MAQVTGEVRPQRNEVIVYDTKGEAIRLIMIEEKGGLKLKTTKGDTVVTLPSRASIANIFGIGQTLVIEAVNDEPINTQQAERYAEMGITSRTKTHRVVGRLLGGSSTRALLFGGHRVSI